MYSAVFLAILTIISIVPAVFVWWRGRRLAQHAEDDAVLAERMAEAQRRNGIVTFFAMVLLIAIGPSYVVLTLLSMWLLVVAADYPARRRIYGESWSFIGYMSFWLRWGIAFMGFWSLLAIAPWLVQWSEARWVPVALVLLTVLCIWTFKFHDVFVALLRAQPLKDEKLEAAFEAVLARATVPRPRIWRSDPDGGLVLTAFALPSPKRGGVLFLQPLLERLPQRETVAIFAHEVAHLEQFARRPLRLLTIVGLLPVVAAVLLVPALERFAPGAASITVMAWPIIVFTAVVLRQRRHQPLELSGDRRAAELCGDPDALASGLIRLYALARMPRRIDVDVERWASHPSLARRVQALRALSAQPPARVEEPKTFPATDQQDSLTFEGGGIRIGSGAIMPYSELHELRLQFRGEAPQVVGRDRNDRVFQVPIRREDAPAVHAVLDQVDGLLTPDLPRSSIVGWGGTLAAFAALAAALAGMTSVFVAAGLATFKASAATLAAAATATAAGGLLLWAAGPGTMPPLTAWILWAFAILLAVATVRAAGQHPHRLQRIVAHIAIATLALGTAAAWTLGVLLQTASAWGLHQAALATPAIAVFPLSLAAVLAWGSSPIRRALAVAVLIVGVVPVIAASDWFVSHAVDDPFLAGGPRLGVAVATLDGRRPVSLGTASDDIQLSPGGRWMAASMYDESGESEVVRFALHAVDGRQLELAARNLAFLDDQHVVVSDRDPKSGPAAGSVAASEQPQSLELTVRRLEPRLPIVWRESIPHAALWQLDVASRSRKWRLVGWGDRGAAVRFEGLVGTAGWVEQRWPVPANGEASGIWYVGSGRYAVRLEGFELPSWRTTLRSAIGGISPFTGHRQVWIVDSEGGARRIESALKVNCVAPPVGRDAITCLAFDGRRTHVFRLGRDVVPVARIEGALWLSREHEDGTLVGRVDGRSVLIQPDAGRMIRFDRSGIEWFELAYAGPYVAITTFGDGSHTAAQIARLRLTR